VFFPCYYDNLSEVEFAMKKMEDSRRHIWQSISMSKQNKGLRNLLYCYKFKASLDSSLGMKDSAIYYLREYVRLQDSVSNAALFKKMAEM
jgi:hypothetical protein